MASSSSSTTERDWGRYTPPSRIILPPQTALKLLTVQKNQWNLSKPARVLRHLLLSALTFCVQPGGDVYSRVVLHSSHGANWFPHGAGGARSDDQ